MLASKVKKVQEWLTRQWGWCVNIIRAIFLENQAASEDHPSEMASGWITEFNHLCFQQFSGFKRDKIRYWDNWLWNVCGWWLGLSSLTWPESD